MFFKKRLYGKTNHITIEALKEKFKSNQLDYIKIAVLFGSRAINKQKEHSDYDIAIVATESKSQTWGVLSQAYNDIGDVLQLAEYDYDVVNLNTATKLIKNSIKTNYILLKGDKNELQRILG